MGLVRIAGLGIVAISAIQINYATANCSGTRGGLLSLCKGLDQALDEKSCTDLDHDTLAYATCQAIHTLQKGESCSFSQGDEANEVNLYVCGQIYQGFLRNSCNFEKLAQEKKKIAYFFDQESWENLCQFGRFISDEFIIIRNKRERTFLNSIVTRELDTFLRHKTELSPEELARIKTKVLQLSWEITHFFFGSKSKLKDPGVSFIEYLSWLVETVEVIETNLKSWRKESTLKKGSVYKYPGEFVAGGRALANLIQINPEGRVFIYFHPLANAIEGLGLPRFKSLGEGSQTAYYPSIDYETGKIYATGVPKVSGSRQSIEVLERIKRGFRIQSQFQGIRGIAPVSRFEEYEDWDGQLRWMATMKYYSMDLIDFIGSHQRDKVTFNGKSMRKIKTALAVDLLEGLTFLHESGIHHRDIKVDNILIEMNPRGDFTAAISDFDLVYDVRNRRNNDRTPEFGGTPLYVSPQYLRLLDNKDLKNDVWGMGIVLLYLFYQRNVIFQYERVEDEARNVESIKMYEDLKNLFIQTDWFEKVPQSDSLEFIFYRMMNPDASARISAREALELMQKFQRRIIKEEEYEFPFSGAIRIKKRSLIERLFGRKEMSKDQDAEYENRLKTLFNTELLKFGDAL